MLRTMTVFGNMVHSHIVLASKTPNVIKFNCMFVLVPMQLEDEHVATLTCLT